MLLFFHIYVNKILFCHQGYSINRLCIVCGTWSMIFAEESSIVEGEI